MQPLSPPGGNPASPSPTLAEQAEHLPMLESSLFRMERRLSQAEGLLRRYQGDLFLQHHVAMYRRDTVILRDHILSVQRATANDGPAKTTPTPRPPSPRSP